MATTTTARKTAAAQEEAAPAARHGGVYIPLPGGMTGRVLWWGGLATVAAVGLVDWPVAVVVAAGTWVAEQRAKAAVAHPDGEQEPVT